MKIDRLKYPFFAGGRFFLKSIVAAIWLFFNPSLLFSQNIDNLHIEKVQDDGLTDESIPCITQDKYGFMWFGTGDGVFRYDGYNFKPFRSFPGDSAALINNGVNALYPDDRNLWVGTTGGLSCIDINTQKLSNFYVTKSLRINAIAPKNDSVLWVATPIGLYQFNKKKFSWAHVPAAAGNLPVNSIADDHKGHLYLTTNDGFFCYTTASAISVYHQLDLPTYPKKDDKNASIPFGKSVIDNAGNLWMGTWDAGLVRFNAKTKKIDVWSHQNDDVHLLPYKIIMWLLPDPSGNIWLANKEGGLTIFDPSKNRFVNYPVEWKNENKISDAVVSLFRDRSGIVWIGTENGIFKYDPHHVYLSKKDLYLKTDTGIIPAHISPIAMLRDQEGTFWVGMYEGLFILDEKTGILTDCNAAAGLSKQFAYAVFNITQDKKGAIWVTAKNQLIKITKKPNASFTSEIFKADDIKSTMYNLFIDGENRIWIGTHSEGIFRFDPATKTFTSYHYDTRNKNGHINEIQTFCELSKDSLLFGGAHTGLILLHTNTGKYEKIHLKTPANFDADPSLGAIRKKGDTLWIGTDDYGLWQTTTRFTPPAIETINDGLPSMQVSSILGDQQNNLWLLTTAGEVRYQISGKKTTVFDKRDGIQNLNELNASIVDKDNTVFFGARGAIYKLNVASITKNESPPKVFITDMKVFDKDYPIYNGETVKLSYNQNYFSFEYVALNYTQTRLNRYAYQMAGLDKKWNYAGARRYVSYANLDEGTYTFYVKGCNNEGIWNNIPTKLTLIISPPFWRSWWFYLLVVLFVAAVVYTLYAYSINQLRIRLQMRDKIASDLHDEIGSTLSGINIFSKIALQQMPPGQPGRELMEKISDRAKTTMDALSDIVWSINTRNDGMDNFLIKAREYFSVLDAQDIAYDFTVDDDIGQLKIGMILKNELYLIFKEAVCNASKYAECSFVQICLTRHKDTCTLLVRDDGKGFNIHTVLSGNGIYNMQQRAKKMNAEFHIDSEENKGTTVTLKFKITQYR